MPWLFSTSLGFMCALCLGRGVPTPLASKCPSSCPRGPTATHASAPILFITHSATPGWCEQWGLDLLWRLLRWDPMSRISASDALEHAYFVGPYRSRRDGTLHATQRSVSHYSSSTRCPGIMPAR